MTLPITHGYPDWTRTKAEADLSVLDQRNIVQNGITTFGPTFVGGLAALYLNFSATAVRARCQFRFYLDAAGTQLVDNDAVVTNINGYFTGPVPVFGPWVFIDIEGSAYPNTYSAIVVMQPDAASATGSEGSAGRILHGNPVNVGAATTTTVTANASWRGAASIYAEIPAATCSIEIEALQLAGFTRLLWSLNGAVLRDTQIIGVHTDAIRIRLVNPTAGALNFRYAMTALRRSG